MTTTMRTTVVALLLLSAAGLAGGSAYGQNGRLPMLTNERGGPPIARWRVHAKILEGLPQARKIDFIVKYARAAQLQSEELVVLSMALRRVDLASASRLAGVDSRIGDLEQMLRREQRAGELRLTGKGPATKLVPIWPPPGYHHKKGVRPNKGE